MTQPLSLGFIGCGGIARAHLKAAQELGLPIRAICDVLPASVQAFGELVPDAAQFHSVPELLGSGLVDAVIICTPPGSHAEIAIAALRQGLNVLCEKPLASSVAESCAIEEAVAASGKVFMMAFRHRFTAAQQKIKSLLDTGDFGRVVLFENVFGGPAHGMKDKWFSKKAISGGGTVIDTSIHSIDLFRHYCGDVVSYNGELDHAFDETDVEDSNALVLRAENGALGIIAASWNYGGGVADLRIVAEKGTIVYNYLKPTVLTVTRLGAKGEEVLEVGNTAGFTEQLAHFAEAVRGGTEPLTTVRDGRCAAEIVEGIYARSPLNR